MDISKRVARPLVMYEVVIEMFIQGIANRFQQVVTHSRLRRLTDDQTDLLLSLLDILEEHLEKFVLLNVCPITAGAFLGLVSDVLESYKAHASHTVAGTVEARFYKFSTNYRYVLVEYMNTIGKGFMDLVIMEAIQVCVEILDSILSDIEIAGDIAFPILELPKNYEALESSLRSSGVILGKSYVTNSKEERFSNNLVAWARVLQLTLNDETSTSSFDDFHGHPGVCKQEWQACETSVRLATVQAIGGFFKQVLEARRLDLIDRNIQSKDPVSFHLFIIYICLYTAMIDDDEDVRTEGATIAMAIINTNRYQQDANPGLDVSAPSAKVRFLDFLSQHYGKTIELRAHSMVRSVGQTSVNDCRYFCIMLTRRLHYIAGTTIPDSHFPAGANLRSDNGNSTGVLFQEERSNLYVDEYRETQHWCGVLSGLPTTDLVVEHEMVSSLTNKLDPTGPRSELAQFIIYDSFHRTQHGPSAVRFMQIHHVVQNARILIHYIRTGRFNTKSGWIRNYLIAVRKDIKEWKIHCLLRDEIDAALQDFGFLEYD